MRRAGEACNARLFPSIYSLLPRGERPALPAGKIMQMAVRVIPAVCLLLLFTALGARSAQAEVSNRQYLYRFENARFEISLTEISLAANGEGEMRYRKRDEDEDIT